MSTVAEVSPAAAQPLPIVHETTGNLQGRPVFNSLDQVKPLVRFCTERQVSNDQLSRNLAQTAACVAMVVVSIFTGILLTPLAGIFLGIATYFSASALFDAIASKYTDDSYEKAALALGDPNFIEFANEKKYPLNMDTIFKVLRQYNELNTTNIK